MTKKPLYKNNKYRLEYFDFLIGEVGSPRNIVIIDNKTSVIQTMRALQNFKFCISDYEYENKFIDFCIESQLFIITKKDQYTLFECNNNLKLLLL